RLGLGDGAGQGDVAIAERNDGAADGAGSVAIARESCGSRILVLPDPADLRAGGVSVVSAVDFMFRAVAARGAGTDRLGLVGNGGALLCLVAHQWLAHAA